jgi:hypothetical protein
MFLLAVFALLAAPPPIAPLADSYPTKAGTIGVSFALPDADQQFLRGRHAGSLAQPDQYRRGRRHVGRHRAHHPNLGPLREHLFLTVRW